MTRKLCSCIWYRNFSESRIGRNLEKSKPNEPEKNNSADYMKMDFIPNEIDKRVLVWSGKFKNKDSIPKRISFHTYEYAKSRFRIRVANLMILGTVALCGFYIWLGKKRLREAHSKYENQLEN